MFVRKKTLKFQRVGFVSSTLQQNMKLLLKVKCGDKKRTFEVAVGSGNKTFKWLGHVGAQMYSNSQPKGAIRSREHFRGPTLQTSYNVDELELPNKDVPHPMSLIEDYVRDGDTIKIVLCTNLKIGESGGTIGSAYNNLSNINSTSNPAYVDDAEYLEEDMDAIYGGGLFGDVTVESTVGPRESIDTIHKHENTKLAHIKFMRMILTSQQLNLEEVNKEITSIWSGNVRKLMPQMNLNDSKDLQGVIRSHFAVIHALFVEFTKEKPGEMSRLMFKNMMDEAKVFGSDEEFEEMTMRIFRLVSKGESFIHFGDFIVALVLCSQSRYHNVLYGKSHDVSGPRDSLEAIIKHKIFPLAKKKRMRIRDELYGDDCMSVLYDMYEDLFTLFEKYAAKEGRDLTISMPVKWFAQLMQDAEIVFAFAEEEEERQQIILNMAEDILNRCQIGFINGRTKIPDDLASDNDLPPPPTEDFSFPEFIEGIARATFYMLEEDEVVMFEEDHMLDGFTKALKCLIDKEE